VPVSHQHPNIDWSRDRDRDRTVALRQLANVGLTDLDRMYLVGGGTHPGSGLPVIFESARISARLVLEDLGEAA
jgi:phytoene desaturase